MQKGEFTGVFKDGVRTGYGRLEWSNGEYYEGEFRDGLRHGKGNVISYELI
jgi:hypothetical protein